MRRRKIEPEDVPAVLSYLEALGEEWADEAVGERKIIGLLHRPDGWLAEKDDGAILGVAPAVVSGSWRTFEVATRSADVARSLIAATVEEHPTDLRVWALRRRFVDVIVAAGFRPERSLHRMTTPLPIEAEPAGRLAVRGFRPGDEMAWLDVNNRAFAGHPEQGGLTVEDFIERTELSWWRPEDLRLGVLDGEVVGFCWTKRHPDGRGEIYAIGVDPAVGGMGLGRELLTAGLGHLADLGCPSAILYVDAGNEAAMALYLDIGFRREHTDEAFVRDQPKRR